MRTEKLSHCRASRWDVSGAVRERRGEAMPGLASTRQDLLWLKLSSMAQGYLCVLHCSLRCDQLRLGAGREDSCLDSAHYVLTNSFSLRHSPFSSVQIRACAFQGNRCHLLKTLERLLREDLFPDAGQEPLFGHHAAEPYFASACTTVASN
nr:hypothetical protein [Lysobacter panacisoli]